MKINNYIFVKRKDMAQDIKEYRKKYREANKEKLDAYNKAWVKANKEKRTAISKTWQENQKDGLYTVYLLTNENYVGQTDNLYQRLLGHKSKHNRNVEDVKIIGKYKTRKEALDVERSYHNKGYKGMNKSHKKKGSI
tara:strand:+ start:286 stop:696 length:411 start_codon:yes stop_codon:yes gene_type:complete